MTEAERVGAVVLAAIERPSIAMCEAGADWLRKNRQHFTDADLELLAQGVWYVMFERMKGSVSARRRGDPSKGNALKQPWCFRMREPCKHRCPETAKLALRTEELPSWAGDDFCWHRRGALKGVVWLDDLDAEVGV